VASGCSVYYGCFFVHIIGAHSWKRGKKEGGIGKKKEGRGKEKKKKKKRRENPSDSATYPNALLCKQFVPKKKQKQDKKKGKKKGGRGDGV